MKTSHLLLIGVLLLTACGAAEDDPADEPSIPAPSTGETTTTRAGNTSDTDLITDSVDEGDSDQADEESGVDTSESTVPPTTEYVPSTTKDGLPEHPEPSIPPPRD